MGAPVAVIVLEELAALGALVVLRAGTAMAVGGEPDLLGAFVLARGAVRGEATSATYAPADYPAVADSLLLAKVRQTLEASGARFREGLLASYDGFYTELFAAAESRREAVAARLAELSRLGVLGADMETSALLVVGTILGVRTGSLCLVTVDGQSRARLDNVERRAGEESLVDAALSAVVATPFT
jgi:uridine phosphorylase